MYVILNILKISNIHFDASENICLHFIIHSSHNINKLEAVSVLLCVAVFTRQRIDYAGWFRRVHALYSCAHNYYAIHLGHNEEWWRAFNASRSIPFSNVFLKNSWIDLFSIVTSVWARTGDSDVWWTNIMTCTHTHTCTDTIIFVFLLNHKHNHMSHLIVEVICVWKRMLCDSVKNKKSLWDSVHITICLKKNRIFF